MVSLISDMKEDDVINKTVDDAIAAARRVINSSLSGAQKRVTLNRIESEHKQDIFIKTHLCSCGKLDVEIWRKI